MSRITSVLLAVLLLVAFMPEAQGQGSQDPQLASVVVPPKSVTIVVSSPTSKAMVKLLKVGGKIYVTKMRGHTKAYQKRVLKHLSAYHRKAVYAFLSQYGAKKYVVNVAYCPRNKMCPMYLVSSSPIHRLSVNSLGTGGCWDWTITVSEGAYQYITPWPFPIWVEWYKFQLYNSFCSDGTNITYFYAEPSSVSTLTLFWDYQSFTESYSRPDIPTPKVDYSVHAKYEMSPPIVSKIAVLVHRNPWIRVHVLANGTATYEEGVDS